MLLMNKWGIKLKDNALYKLNTNEILKFNSKFKKKSEGDLFACWKLCNMNERNQRFFKMEIQKNK